jgi:hypothetical protein
VAVAIIGAVVGMGLVAGFLVGGAGPYSADVVEVDPVAEAAVVVTVEVANDGSRAGRARCELTAMDEVGSPVSRTVALSPEVPPGTSIDFEAQIPGLSDDPARVSVRCQ